MSTQLFDLSGKIAFVTGGVQGLGFAMATGLGQAGATLIVNGRKREKMEKALAAFREKGIQAHGYLFDLRDKAAVASNVEKMQREAGPIDILVNNAGIIRKGALESLADEDWAAVLDTNLTAVFNISKAVVSRMIERGKGGKVINVCSMMSELGRPSTGAYAASKGGLKMLTKAMAVEWARHNIQVNGIGPGYHLTAITQPLADNPDFNSLLMARTPAKRWGTLEDLIGPAVFLASDASGFVNGHILYVDGGILASFGDLS